MSDKKDVIGINDIKNDKFLSKLDTLEDDWLSGTMMVAPEDVDVNDRLHKLYDTADSKFTDTTLGGNLGINNIPQYTRYADPRRHGIATGIVKDYNTKTVATNIGMGRYYSKAHDDNNNILIMEFGTIEKQSIFSYFSRGISYPDSVFVNDGRTPYLYYGAKAFGTLARWRALPVLSIALLLIDSAKTLINGAVDTRFFHLKPDMYAYWNSVNQLVNTFAVERGLTSVMLEDSSTDRIGNKIKLTSEDLEKLGELSNGFITKNGYIDCFAIANRSQGRLIKRFKQQLEDNGTATDFEFKTIGEVETIHLGDMTNKDMGGDSYIEHKKDPHAISPPSDGGVTLTKEEFDSLDKNGQLRRIDADDNKGPNQKDSYFESLYKYYKSTMKAGGTKAIFNVEKVDGVSITASNTLKEPSIKSMFNSASNAARDIRFNVGGGDILGSTVETVVNQTQDVLAGLADGITAGISNALVGLLGGGYIDIDQVWDNSNVKLSEQTYKIIAKTPYNNPVSCLMNLDFVVSMLLAGTLPRSVGSASYSSPFYCSSYLRGVQDENLGMITELSISTGGANATRGINGVPLSLEITFKVTGLSTIAVSPIPGGFSGAFDLSLDDTKPLNRYISSLCGRDYYTSKYMTPKIKKRLEKLSADFNSAMSPSRLGMFLGDSWIGKVNGLFAKDLIQ